MNDKEIIKHIDLIIKDINDFDYFSIDNIVRENLKPEEKNKKEHFSNLIEKIVLFGQNNDLFVLRNKSVWFKLTNKDNISNMIKKIVLFRKNNDIYGLRNKSGWFKLTDKGKRLKLSKKSFINFEKSLRSKPLDLYQKIYLPFFICFGLLGLYKTFF